MHTYKDNSKLYDKIFNSIPDIAYIKGVDGRYILANQSFADITRVKAEFIAGKSDYDFFDKELADLIKIKDKEVIEKQKPLTIQYHVTLNNGEKALYETKKTPIFDKDGNTAGIIGIGRNVTNQKSLENSLIESKNHQKAILDNLPFMSWLKDNESRFLYVNDPFTKLCQTTLENMIGKTDLDFFPKEMAEGYRDDDFEVMASRKKKHVEELIKTPEGNVWFETYKMPIVNLSGEVIGTTGFARDITERKKVDMIKNEFISVMSHELRTPLTSIKGALGLIASGKYNENTDKIMDLAQIADKNCSILINLINDILDIEKIEAGKMNFNFQTYDINDLIIDAIKLNKSYVEQFGIKINFVSYANKPLVVKVDKDKFIQVMTNLISNATKFSEENSRIDISLESYKKFARVKVKDYGTGIPKKIQHKIFDRFIQGDSSDRRNKGGTGLGLNICETILHKMRGMIDFETQEGKGSTFYFDLPTIANN